MARTSDELDRRSFLKLGIAASSLVAASACRKEDLLPDPSGSVDMRYRPLGRTGLRVSEVSFGAHGLDNPALLPAALDAGINTYCTSGQYLDGMEEEALGQTIGSFGNRRDELVLFTGNPVRRETTRESILRDIDDSLRRLRTDHVEVYYSSSLASPADLRNEALFEAFDLAKRAGKVRHLALSGHCGGMQEILNAAIDDGRFEIFFTKYDFASYPEQDEILGRAAAQGIGTIVFKTSAGNRQSEIRDLETDGLSFRQATVKWALTNPDISSVCVSFTNFDQIREYADAIASPLVAAEARMLRRYADEMHDKYCRFCGNCEVHCPHQVAVADVMRYAMYFKYYGREKEAMRLYRGLPRQRSAEACARCHAPCAAGCPFGRPVHAELLDAHRLLRFVET